MPEYLVLERSFINNAIVEAGVQVQYDGEAGPNLQLIEAPKPARGKRGADAPAPVSDSAGGTDTTDPASLV